MLNRVLSNDGVFIALVVLIGTLFAVAQTAGFVAWQAPVYAEAASRIGTAALGFAVLLVLVARKCR